ncbi:hypothetical protein ACJJTC_005525 [Scirpophaga incertulas]
MASGLIQFAFVLASGIINIMPNEADIKRLDTFHVKCLRAILRVKWQDRVPNSEILRRAEMTGMESLLMRNQLRWCGHLVLMESFRLPKKVFYSELASGKRKPGGQYLRYRDVLKRHLTAISMSSESWEELATKRTEWRTAVKTGLENFESTPLEELDSKRRHRKTRPKPSYDYTYDCNGNLYCASCNRTFKSKFGFASHARAHARRDQGMS